MYARVRRTHALRARWVRPDLSQPGSASVQARVHNGRRLVAQSLERDCQAPVIVVHIDKVSRRRCARWRAVNVRESSRQLKALLQVSDLKGASVPAELKLKSTSGHVESESAMHLLICLRTTR
jgi:hypothetical protein